MGKYRFRTKRGGQNTLHTRTIWTEVERKTKSTSTGSTSGNKADTANDKKGEAKETGPAPDSSQSSTAKGSS